MENRSFIPGSEWVYFKIYTGAKTADTILKNELYRYAKEIMKDGIADKWFFTRYLDTDFHIRLRLHLKEAKDFGLVFNRFFEIFSPLVISCLVWNIQCDTYQREMERYGTNTISLVEDIFFADSEFIISLLHLLNEENPEQHRWKLALVLIDSFLSAFSFDLSQRKELLNTMAESFKNEFAFTNHNVKKQLDNKFRIHRKDIEKVMLWENEVTKDTEKIIVRRQVISQIAEKLICMDKSHELEVPLKSLMTSIIHMTMNRWFRSKNRLHELVIYDFLARYYTSEMAKKCEKIPHTTQPDAMDCGPVCLQMISKYYVN